jgi:hypothetical protein
MEICTSSSSGGREKLVFELAAERASNQKLNTQYIRERETEK